MLRLHDQFIELNGAAKKYKSRADAALKKVQTAESNAEQLRAENEGLKKDLAEWRERSDRRLEQVKAEHAKALEEARKEAHSAGFTEAGEAYAEDILKLVKAGERRGFGKGFLHCCDVFGVAPEDPKYVVPEMPDSPVADDLDDDGEDDGDAGTPEPEGSADGTPSEKGLADKNPTEGTTSEPPLNETIPTAP